ncbi:probable apyrase 3 [Triticum aestivum]|uniref:probable apyrase 3 n=1 Tax=Triticum aestivum TaxID=4565 RepID=UPI001D0188F3|nr:probable apyrase 3 [Triticum aestivum]
MASQVGLIDSDAPSGTSTPAAFRAVAQKLCRMSLKEVKVKYPKVRDVPTFAWTSSINTPCSSMGSVWSPPRILHSWRR